MILNSNTAATATEAAADMAKPIPMSRQETDMSSKEVATTKRLATHMPNKPATPTLRNPLRHSKPMEDDSNREATRVDTVRLRQQIPAALLIHPVQVRRAAATVKSIPRTILGRELTVTSWRE